MPSTLHPSDGVRVLLELEGDPAPGATARYAASILGPALRVDYHLRFDDKGAIELAAVDEASHAAVDPRAVDLLRAIARTVARHALGDDPPTWPRRVLRWRKL